MHRLLFHALLEMRSQGHETHNQLVYWLSDLFHAVVLEMERAAEGKASYDDVLELLRQRAVERGLERWLAEAIAKSSHRGANWPDAPVHGEAFSE